MKKNFLLSFMLMSVVMFSVSSCKSSKGLAEVNGMTWTLEKLNDKEVDLSDKEKAITIIFDTKESRVSGSSACNRFFGDYKMDGKKLDFMPMGATRMHCPDMDIEQKFFLALDKIDSYEISGDKLLLKENKKVLISFTLDKK